MDKTAPAFPQPHGEFGSTNGELHAEHGMTLRDYFAAKAMQSIVAVLHQGIRPSDITRMCQDCYSIADAMLAERSKP